MWHVSAVRLSCGAKAAWALSCTELKELSLCSALPQTLALQVRTLLQKPALQKLMQRETEALQLM